MASVKYTQEMDLGKSLDMVIYLKKFLKKFDDDHDKYDWSSFDWDIFDNLVKDIPREFVDFSFIEEFKAKHHRGG